MSIDERPISTPLPFVRGWLRDPVGVGLPFPSSSATARRLARAAVDAAIPGTGPVLELGAGTGAVTEALIECRRAVEGIVAVERDVELCRALERRFPGLQVLHGDALDIGTVLSKAGLASVCVVVSGLPMRAIPSDAAGRCYSEAFEAMPPGGAIIQYTYGLRPPVDPEVTGPTFEATFIGREWRNFPPMGIWRYRLAG
ncbi:class I SAM-dependent methyltransferase [Reyranella sp.]|uniref:class I SAM-dependent methyltransferase n=1 Tax=Reyranella sp. TaxID=1929291 RepID=UPI003D1197D2